MVQKVIATGQITITDYNDAITLNMHLTPNKTRYQQYNPDTESYSPVWDVASPVIITPSLFRLGGGGVDIFNTTNVTNVKWYDVTAGVESQIVANASYEFVMSSTRQYQLKVKANVMAGLVGKTFRCKLDYLDPDTGLSIPIIGDVDFTLTTNGSGIANALAWLPDGQVFKNDTPASIIAQCDFWRGAIIDATGITYQWYNQDPTATTTVGGDVNGGNGWRKLTNVAGVTENVTTNRMKVFPDAVPGYEVFQCVTIDTNAGNVSTYDKPYRSTVTILDYSDPINLELSSDGGNIIRKGQVRTLNVTCVVRRGKDEIDVAGTAYTYKWYKNLDAGGYDPNFGGTGINFRLGKTIQVTNTDVLGETPFDIDLLEG